MKKLLVLALMALPMISNAGIVTFECKSAEVDGVHKFDAKGIVSVDEDNKVEGIISVQVQKAQAEDSIQVFEEIKIAGTHKRFEAGEITTNPFDQLILWTKNSYVRNFNLLIDFKSDIASQIFSVDNFVYRSNCYSVQSIPSEK